MTNTEFKKLLHIQEDSLESRVLEYMTFFFLAQIKINHLAELMAQAKFINLL